MAGKTALDVFLDDIIKKKGRCGLFCDACVVPSGCKTETSHLDDITMILKARLTWAKEIKAQREKLKFLEEL